MDEMVLLINECKRMKIKLGLPDINKCFSEFTINDDSDKQVLFGLTAIKNVGRVAVDNIIKEREKNGIYTSFVDFCSRIDTRIVNKKTIESLIYSGAFDSLDKNRKKLNDYFEAVLLRYGTKKSEISGQSNLFMGVKSSTPVKDIILEPLGDNYSDWSDREKLSREKSVLGLYISSHPLNDFEAQINKIATLKFGELTDIENEQVDFGKLQQVRMCGIINNLRIKQSKKGNRFAVFMLEDFTGQGECVVFPKTYEQNREILRDDAIVSVIGKAEENGNTIKLIADEIKPLFITRNTEGDSEKVIEKITINVDSNTFSSEKIYKLKGLLSKNGGTASVYINLKNGSKHSILELESIKINYDEFTAKVLSEIFGKENIILQ
jgi:DNA polymerase-3 subunit alpha